MKQRVNKEILLVSIESLRLLANQNCWETQSLILMIHQKHMSLSTTVP
ncbi:hypothetical protein SAMN04488101_10983 [Pedobacter nyackensis]|uniref:Uncharacterized protein n=1 Tax=Pedobacter nyackensis TaxID=475255 RepID=A0A1W2E253_9SPHI|nr:hypothetical protein SAMN04488101_10983 [Pedobacter nyackensis]